MKPNINRGQHHEVWIKLPGVSLRLVHTRELAPETRSQNTLQGKYSNQYTRRSLLLKHAPETRSRNTLPKHAPG